tara:strand:+ start:792 stop:1022 length:231 start_codon:yes stop_codon:yes gene_type:complete
MDADGPRAYEWVKTEPKKRGCRRSQTLVTTVPEELSVEHDNYAPIAACSDTFWIDETACATLTTHRRAADAPRARL